MVVDGVHWIEKTGSYELLFFVDSGIRRSKKTIVL